MSKAPFHVCKSIKTHGRSARGVLLYYSMSDLSNSRCGSQFILDESLLQLRVIPSRYFSNAISHQHKCDKTDICGDAGKSKSICQ